MSLHEFLGEERALDWYYTANSSNKGLKLGYRRVSGKIGLTNKESGVRGAWVEKRIALFKNLFASGYSIIPFSSPTEATAADGFTSVDNYTNCDILILEFGGTNLQFYKKDWDKTVELIKSHSGKIIFINDDPDLPFLWELLPNEKWDRWVVAANATNSAEVSTILKCPMGVRVVDLPMANGMTFESFSNGNIDKTVYIGRPNGRTKHFKEFLKSPILEISGKPKEWTDFNVNVIENPQQKDRRKFYRNYKGCLTVYDSKHKTSGWRTGRAFHALYAGIPVCAPSGNNGLNWTYPVETAEDLTKFTSLSDEKRKLIWEKQKSIIQAETNIDLILL